MKFLRCRDDAVGFMFINGRGIEYLLPAEDNPGHWYVYTDDSLIRLATDADVKQFLGLT